MIGGMLSEVNKIHLRNLHIIFHTQTGQHLSCANIFDMLVNLPELLTIKKSLLRVLSLFGQDLSG